MDTYEKSSGKFKHRRKFNSDGVRSIEYRSKTKKELKEFKKAIKKRKFWKNEDD